MSEATSSGLNFIIKLSSQILRSLNILILTAVTNALLSSLMVELPRLVRLISTRKNITVILHIALSWSMCTWSWQTCPLCPTYEIA